MKQRTLAMMTGFEQYTRKTRRAIFLEEMEQVVPWRELCALVEPHYPQPGKGRRPVGVERMLRIYSHRPPPLPRLGIMRRSEEHTSELQSLRHLVRRLLLEKKTKKPVNT